MVKRHTAQSEGHTDTLVSATDGSLKDDGRMGAAFVSIGGRVPARSVAVVGAASSTRPELTGIALALEESLPEEDLTILTDSLVAMTTQALFSMRRAYYPLSLHTMERKIKNGYVWIRQCLFGTDYYGYPMACELGYVG